jgi:predicted ATPase
MGESQDNLREPSRLLSLTIDQYSALGQKVRLDLGKRRTVLVGHNGAGKSALIEAISRGLKSPLAPAKGEPRADPRLFEVSMETPLGIMKYDYRWEQPVAPELPGSVWSERFRLGDKELWRSKDGRATWEDRMPHEKISAAGLYLLANFDILDDVVGSVSDLPESVTLGSAAQPLMTLCAFSKHVPAGVPRVLGERTPLSFLYDKETRRWVPTTSDRSRATLMFAQMLKILDEDPPIFGEFVGVCSRLRLFKDFEFFEFSSPAPAATEQRLGAIVCDGMNAALLSDGTLRVMEIVWALLNTQPGALLTIEEPETGIHPGLLVALLSEIDAYLDDRQVLLSTHSPTVIDRVDADEIRLVTRSEEKSVVEPISASNMERLKSYLHFEGELADFVFDGGLY